MSIAHAFDTVLAWLIYIWSAIFTILWSLLFYNLSDLSSTAYAAAVMFKHPQFWVDYLMMGILCGGSVPAFLCYYRHESVAELRKTYNWSNKLEEQLVAGFYCYILPVLYVIAGAKFLYSHWHLI